MRDARLALATGLALVAIVVAIVLSSSPRVLAGTKNALNPVDTPLAAVPGAGSACQAGETLPAGATTVGLSLEATAGPRVAVRVLAGKAVIASGESAPGWLGKLVEVPVAPLNHTVHDTTVCFSFSGANERVTFLGAPTPRSIAARSDRGVLPGRVNIEYLRPGSSSWWSQVLPVARRMGLGRAWAGAWVVVPLTLLTAIGLALASWLTIRESP